MAEYWRIKADNSRLNMADLQSLLLFVKYEKLSERRERVVLPRNNPFDEYDDKKGKTSESEHYPINFKLRDSRRS